MESQRTAIGTTIAVIIIVAVIVGAVTVVSLTTLKHSTASSTATPTETIAGLVSGNFAEHLLLFASRNVSAIVPQYETNASVTWEQILCLSGIYTVTGNGNLTQLLNIFFGAYGQALVVGNVTRTIVTATIGSVMINSTLGLVGQGLVGNFTSTVSAQDTYRYSTTSSTWLISQETWHFLTFYTKGNVPFCIY